MIDATCTFQAVRQVRALKFSGSEFQGELSSDSPEGLSSVCDPSALRKSVQSR